MNNESLLRDCNNEPTEFKILFAFLAENKLIVHWLVKKYYIFELMDALEKKIICAHKTAGKKFKGQWKEYGKHG